MLTSDFFWFCVAAELRDDVIQIDDGIMSQLSIPPISRDQVQQGVEILRPVDLHKPCGKELAVIDGKYII